MVDFTKTYLKILGKTPISQISFREVNHNQCIFIMHACMFSALLPPNTCSRLLKTIQRGRHSPNKAEVEFGPPHS